MASTPHARRCTVGLFAKWPAAGEVKTRLARETSDGFAVRVADAFLRDGVARLVELPYQRFLVFSPGGAEADFAGLTQDRYDLVSQGEGDLGVRMARFLQARIDAGDDAVVLLGTDSPTVPMLYVEHAIEMLAQADVVLGPATDGGYYLVGCGRRLPPIFADVRWGTAHVLADTVARLDPAAWRLAVLPPWYDVDTLDAWHMLRGHAAAIRHAGGDFHIPWTEPLLEEPLP